MENLFDKWLAECEVKLALVNTITDFIERLPVVRLHTRLHESHSKELGCRSSLLVDLLLLSLTLLQFFFETLLVHDRLKKHLVLIIKSLLLLVKKRKNWVFFLFAKM